MKYFLIILVLFLISVPFLFIYEAKAQPWADPDRYAEDLEGGAAQATGDPSGSIQDPLGGIGFAGVTKRVITYFLGLTGVLALIAFIYGGMLWMLSGGDTNRITKGKTMMVWAIFGLAVIFTSYAVLKLVFDALLKA